MGLTPSPTGLFVCCQDLWGLRTGGCNLASSTRVSWSLCSKAGRCCRHLPKALVKGEGHVLTDVPLIPTAIPIGAHPGRCVGGREHLALPTGCTGTCSSPKCPRSVPKIGCAPPCPAQGSYCCRLYAFALLTWPCSLANQGATGAPAQAPAPAHSAQCLAPSWWPCLTARGCCGSHCHSTSAQGRR